MSNTFHFHKFNNTGPLTAVIKSTTMKAEKPKKAGSDTKKSPITLAEEIKTDFPLSEKDEVKKAERKLQKAQKKKS